MSAPENRITSYNVCYTKLLRDLGKLAWKVEFAARWAAFDIRFEAYGKDIMDSVKVNDWVSEEILNYPPPHHVKYEMFLDKGGKKISKSLGRITSYNVCYTKLLRINQIIEKLEMKEIGVMRSRFLPPSTVFMRGRLRHPFRFYANKEGTICAIICEITLRMEGVYSIVSSILDWADKNGSKEIVILDGVASEEHDDKAYCASYNFV